MSWEWQGPIVCLDEHYVTNTTNLHELCFSRLTDYLTSLTFYHTDLYQFNQTLKLYKWQTCIHSISCLHLPAPDGRGQAISPWILPLAWTDQPLPFFYSCMFWTSCHLSSDCLVNQQSVHHQQKTRQRCGRCIPGVLWSLLCQVAHARLWVCLYPSDHW